MEAGDKAENLAVIAANGTEHRQTPRHAVDEDAAVLLFSHDFSYPCRVLDLSMTGCRMATNLRFPGKAGARVEVSFKLRGIVLRFGGKIQWTDGQHVVGIRFANMSSRRKDDLAEVLGEVEALNAAKAAKLAAEKQAAEQQAAQEQASGGQADAEQVAGDKEGFSRKSAEAKTTGRPESATVSPEFRHAVAKPSRSGPLSEELPRPVRPVAKRERRVQSRYKVDNSATILLINIASRVQGRILDLSSSGCGILTDEYFPVGIYTRVETEFHLEGMPFRLGGVVQAIHDRKNVGIRFLDMSARKREQLEQLIEELQELRES